MKVIKNIILKLLFVVALLFCIQTVYYFYVYLSKNNYNKAELMVVLPGDNTRFKAASFLAEKSLTKKILLTGLSKSSAEKIMKGLKNKTIIVLNGGNSFTTFQDIKALKTIIIDHKIKSICLVTSDYHMPRSLFLLKTYLLNCRIKTYTYKAHSSFLLKNDVYKIIWNEFLKFWGSLAEMGFDSFGVDLNETEFFNLEIKQLLKNKLLWSVKIPGN